MVAGLEYKNPQSLGKRAHHLGHIKLNEHPKQEESGKNGFFTLMQHSVFFNCLKAYKKHLNVLVLLEVFNAFYKFPFDDFPLN